MLTLSGTQLSELSIAAMAKSRPPLLISMSRKTWSSLSSVLRRYVGDQAPCFACVRSDKVSRGRNSLYIPWSSMDDANHSFLHSGINLPVDRETVVSALALAPPHKTSDSPTRT